MIYAGIDISKYKHDCFILSDFGEVVNDGFAFTNDAKGFSQFQKVLEEFDSDSIRIGFESTGNYAVNLKLFLEKKGFSFMEINPLLIKEYMRSNSLRRTVTDKICAKNIAGYLCERVYNPYQTDFYDRFALKQLTRFRSSLVTTRSRYLIQLTNILDCVFPEFKQFFGNKFSVTALYILGHYQSAVKISNMNSQSYEKLRCISRGRFSMAKFVELKYLAKNTVGAFNEYYRIELETVLDLYFQIDCKINQVETEITKFIRTIDPPTLSIRGIGEFSAAVIVSEYGDFLRFSNANKMLSFAGLEPGYFQSGTMEHNGRMVKRGSSHLRCALMNCSRSVCLHNEVFATYYRKKRDEGKPHYVAMNHVAKKLVRLIFALETKGLKFDAELLR
ncbi:MAG: IS110 family transposase [Oscillospiraceae bacterium]|nr:IS110 family transposase [Oscillospiraceae bacterium]